MRHVPDGVHALERDLRAIFGERLQSLTVYAAAHGQTHAPAPTLVLVSGLTAGDLGACAQRVDAWHEAGLSTPLLMAGHELERSLQMFPFEFGAILADHVVVVGPSPFVGLHADPADLRRASETRARSHLLHLREGYLETRGRGGALVDLITRSALSLAALVRSVARLANFETDDTQAAARQVESKAGLPAGCLSDVTKLSSGHAIATDEARQLFPRYLEGLEKLTNAIEHWGDA